jgi:hypothetical protein
VRPFLRLPRREILYVAGAALAAFVITLTVLGSTSAAQRRRLAEQAKLDLAQRRGSSLLSKEDLALTVEDFIYPELGPSREPARYELFRPPAAKWSAEQIAKYWIEPRAIALEIISTINDRGIEQLFEKVP